VGLSLSHSAVERKRQIFDARNPVKILKIIMQNGECRMVEYSGFCEVGK